MVLGRIEKIKWSQRVSTEKVLERIEEKRTLLNNIRKECQFDWSYSEKKLPPS